MEVMETYEAPDIVEVGTVAELTWGSASGNELDHSFAAGTPVPHLEFTN